MTVKQAMLKQFQEMIDAFCSTLESKARALEMQARALRDASCDAGDLIASIDWDSITGDAEEQP